MIENVHVIHCKRLAARREYLEPILRELGWEARWIEVHDPGEISRRHLLGLQWGAPLLTGAEISVYLKQLEAFRSIIRSGQAFGFVIEDDAEFPADFRVSLARYRAALPDRFDLVFLGASCGLGESSGAGRPLFVRHSRTRSMSGYLIGTSTCRRLLAELENRPIREPIDLAVDRIIRAHGLDVWWSEPPLLFNGSETGRFGHSLGLPWREGAGRSGPTARAGRVMARIAAAMAARGREPGTAQEKR